MRTRAAFAVDRGLVRASNEDAVSFDEEAQLYAVSDGMGGRNSGEVASRIVVEGIPALLRGRRDDTADVDAMCASISQAVVELGARVFESGQGVPGLHGMGATLVLAQMHREQAIIASIGDSRAYLYRDDRLERRTTDHSILALLIADGEITPEEAASHPARGQLSRFLGMEAQRPPDVFALPLRAGDRLVLCTDGLTAMTSDEMIAAILSRRQAPDAACRTLIGAALDGGGRDNVAVIVIDVLTEPELEASSSPRDDDH